MIAKFFFSNLQDLIALYLFKLKYLLDCYINLYKNLFNEIRSNYKYFNYKTPIYQPDIIDIIVYHKIIKKKPGDKYKAYNNKKYAM